MYTLTKQFHCNQKNILRCENYDIPILMLRTQSCSFIDQLSVTAFALKLQSISDRPYGPQA